MAEPFSDRLRVYQSAIVLAFYWIITWLVGFMTPYLVDETAANLGVYVSYIWFGMGVLSMIWAYLCVPEFAGLAIKEVSLCGSVTWECLVTNRPSRLTCSSKRGSLRGGLENGKMSFASLTLSKIRVLMLLVQ
jgi:hypothetical protein